ncbi:hypothetical protein D3218_00370 [Aureimonas flava]|uniref:Phage tail lysozyme domain-containing protein n=1 Tax=Aureimonas flava TaxID=2320271 RepID=A0A3A1WRF8_9HYPH|nr:phage tail tip lysozyme [Aureimonas flava]RIY03265.1 hypothetical protein D3218_00370 [Aureimonas flava]
MANKRIGEVSYRPLQVAPVLQDGLLAVDRPDGGPERRVAEAFARMAAQADDVADRFAAAEGQQAGLRDALANGPRASAISGGVTTSVEGGGAPLGYTGSGGGVSSRVSTGGGDLDARGRYIYEGLRKRKLGHFAAAAAVGHARQESSIQAAGPDGDKGTSSGLWQWRNERRSALQAFAKRPGQNGDWRDVDTQMDFFVHELGGRERLAGQRLAAATNIVDATEALMHFERPQHYTVRTPRAGHGWDNRLAHARWAEAFGGGAGAPAAVTALAPTPAPTGAAAAIEAVAPLASDGKPAAGTSAIAPADVGPPRVTRVVEPIEIQRAGGGFRPTGSTTIRGRAYDTAGMRTYLEQLDNTIAADTDAVYQRFKDDPVELEKAFGALRTVHMQDHVFPEVQGDYDGAFGRVTRGYLNQSRRDQETRVLQQDRADFLTRSGEMETASARAVEAFDPGSDDAAAAIALRQSATDAHYDSAVARGILDADDAAAAKIASRRNTAVAFYARQATVLPSPQDVLALKEKMRTDFAAGGMAGLDAGGWQALEASLDRTASQKQQGQQEASRTLKARGDALADSVVRGFEVDAGEMGRFMLDRNTTPEGPQIIDRTLEKINAARILRDKPLPEAERYVLGLERDPVAVAGGTADYARAELERMQRAAGTDPVGLAERKGLLPAEEGGLVEASSADDLAGRMKLRAERAEIAAQHFGVQPKYLKPGEAAQIKVLVDQDPDRAAQIAAGIVTGAGARAGRVLAELGEDAPAVEQAGVILAGGGSERAARDVIAGYGRGADGQKLPEVLKQTERDSLARETIGGAFAGSPADGTRTLAAAERIARVRVAEAGIDPKSEAARGILEKAIHEAAGGRFESGVQFGGFVAMPVRDGWFGSSFAGSRPTVFVLPSIRADRFADVIDAIRDTDLASSEEPRARLGRRYWSAPPVRENGKAYTAADLKAAVPVAVGGGYRFAFGDPASEDPQWVRGADGRPFVLAIDTMRPILEPRVPGAYR